jgi:hypothetical protein
VDWTITNIPKECELAPMTSTFIVLNKLYGASLGQNFFNSTFTFGHSTKYNNTIEIESNVTNTNYKSFTSSNWTELATNDPVNTWVVKRYSNLTPPTTCYETTTYKTRLGIPAATIPHNSWGGCEGKNGSFEKITPANMTNGSGLYYINIYGIYGPNNEKNEILKIDINLTRENQIKKYVITDYYNTTTPNATLLGNGYIYAGCTIPEQLPLDPNDPILINFTGDAIYLDYMKITTTPNPDGIPNCTNTEMKCGRFTDIDRTQILGRACNVTSPWPQQALCNNTNQYCVYGNENGQGNPANTCYSVEEGEETINVNGTIIRCQPGQTWCPEQFMYTLVPTLGWVCVPSPDMCDYGDSGNTLKKCENITGSTQPGFFNNKPWCLNEFDDVPEEGPVWNSACCEFLRVPRTALSDYLFFKREEVKIY